MLEITYETQQCHMPEACDLNTHITSPNVWFGIPHYTVLHLSLQQLATYALNTVKKQRTTTAFHFEPFLHRDVVKTG
jgi:hypothetical protein